MALLADAVVLLRARALLGRPRPRQLLAGLMPLQLSLELGAESPHARFPQAKRKSAKHPMKSPLHALVFVTPSDRWLGRATGCAP